MSLNEFHAANIRRQHEAFAPPHPLTALVVCVQEEVGELAAAVLGVTGEKKRKAHLTNADVLDAVADAMTYLSLVAGAVGCTDLEKLLGDTFNMVSTRAGSTITTRLGQAITDTEAGDANTKSLREWLASWGDGSHWSDNSGKTVPISKVTLTALLDETDRVRGGLKKLRSEILDDRDQTPRAKASYGHVIERLLDKDAP